MSVSERVNQRFPGSKLIPSSVTQTAVVRDTAEISFQSSEKPKGHQDTTHTSSFMFYTLMA